MANFNVKRYVVQLIAFLPTLIVFDRIDRDRPLICNDEEAFQFLNGNGKLYARATVKSKLNKN